MGENTLSIQENSSIAVSFIVPIYNAEQYLTQCVDSILSQTYPNFEILLIDDGSTDSSGDICDEYAKKDNRVRVFHKENGGVSSARNLGLNKAQGKWISFADSDDWLNQNYLSTLLEDVSIADLTYFGCSLFYPDNNITVYMPAKFYSHNREEIEKCLAHLKMNQQLFEYFGYTWNKLFRKSIIDDYNLSFVENLTLREDELFTLSYARYISSIRVKSVSLYNYRILSTGLTHQLKSKKEYLFLIEHSVSILYQYQNKQLISIIENSILSYYFRALSVDKLFAKSWFCLLHRFIAIGKDLLKQDCIIDKKMKLIFKYNCIFYQYMMAITINVISRLVNQTIQ